MSATIGLRSVSNRVNIDRDSATATTTRRLRESGNSVVLTMPPELLDMSGFSVGDDIRLTADMDEGTILMEHEE